MIDKITRRGIFLSAALLSVAFFAATPSQAQTKISEKQKLPTSQELKIAIEDIGRTLPKRMSAAQKQQYLINYLADLNLAAKQAIQQKLHKTPQFSQKMAYFRKKALMETFMDNVKKDAIKDKNVNATYLEASKRHRPQQQVRAKHILVKDKAAAEKALERLRKGEDFSKLARQISKDPGSPGGNLGWFSKERMVPAFAEVAFKTKVGEISAPVKSRFGWHIIKVEGRRKSQFPPLKKVRSQIEKYLTRQAQAKAIKELRLNSAKEKPKGHK